MCICEPQTPKLSPASALPFANHKFFPVSMSLFLFHWWVYLCHILDPTYKCYQMSFSVWFTSLNMKSLASSIFLQMAWFRSFLWLSNTPLCIYIPHKTSFLCSFIIILLPHAGYMLLWRQCTSFFSRTLWRKFEIQVKWKFGEGLDKQARKVVLNSWTALLKN